MWVHCYRCLKCPCLANFNLSSECLIRHHFLQEAPWPTRLGWEQGSFIVSWSNHLWSQLFRTGVTSDWSVTYLENLWLEPLPWAPLRPIFVPGVPCVTLFQSHLLVDGELLENWDCLLTIPSVRNRVSLGPLFGEWPLPSTQSLLNCAAGPRCSQCSYLLQPHCCLSSSLPPITLQSPCGDQLCLNSFLLSGAWFTACHLW